ALPRRGTGKALCLTARTVPLLGAKLGISSFQTVAFVSQRDSAPKPKVGRHDLPWEHWPKRVFNAEGVASIAGVSGRNPVGVVSFWAGDPG
ncbi:MAG: hypothetical protein ACI9VS_003311, partial [Candidatus Binatia bacterium]